MISIKFYSYAKFVGFVHLDELLRIVNLLFEQDKRGHLTNKIFANTDHVEFWISLIKIRVVHRKVNYLFVINDSD